MSTIRVITAAVSLAWADVDALRTPGIVGFLVRELGPVDVYAEPRMVAARFRLERPPVQELGYETDYGLVVLEARAAWVRIGVKQWLPMRRGERVRALEEFFQPSDSDMWRWIGEGPMPLWSEGAKAMRVVGQERRGKEVWLDVEVLDRSSCESGEVRAKILGRGWVPLKDTAGRLNFWYYTRGC